MLDLEGRQCRRNGVDLDLDRCRIGERINWMFKNVKQAIRDQDASVIPVMTNSRVSAMTRNR